MNRLFLCFLVVTMRGASLVQGQTVPVDGLRDNTPSVHAFINARIVPAPGREIPRGTLVIRDGIIEAATEPPPDARIWDLKGATIYAGLIDPYSHYGLPKAEDGRSKSSTKGTAHWNEKARGDVDVADLFAPDAQAAEKLRAQGLTIVHVVPRDGIFRGRSAVITLGDGHGRDLVVQRRAASVVSFYEEGGFFSGYPHSLMGIIAFIRQSFSDADWYRRAWESFGRNPNKKRPETNATLAALSEAIQGRQPVIMEANDDFSFLRAARIGREFSLKLLIRGSGEEYRRLDAVKQTGIPVIVPLNFPEPPRVDTPEDALNVSLEDLYHWDAAPENPGRLAAAGIPIALTSAELKDAGTFLAQVRKAVARGLTRDKALAAMTTEPASMLGIESRYGTLDKGKAANLLIADGDLFDEKTAVREVWIDGRRYEVKVSPPVDVRGTWNVMTATAPPDTVTLSLKGKPEKLSGELIWKGKEMKLSEVTLAAGRLSFSVKTDSIGWAGSTVMSAIVTAKSMAGVGIRPTGEEFRWSATWKSAMEPEPDTGKPKKVTMASFADVFPPGEYGRPGPLPQPEHVLVRNATIWTQSSLGRLEQADMLVTKGKIARVGKGIPVPRGAVVIDGTGKHVTPGLIDCHSHTATASINEGGQAVTCETRIEDVLDSDNIWIYRQLAGGTTAANILHGSANPIGGQNAVVKWRWGALPMELLIADAPPGVKFALGENVKRSNFTPPPGTPARYPATRMGVEQLLRDRFKAAQDYDRSWKAWERKKSGIPPRRDLELDAIVEMLNGKRLIHAHSYRQDEILMLLRLAEEFGIRIATFQHVLEGYKVADAIARHGAGASTFSDWWAYKIEAWDAIPANGPLMHQQGVLVSYNSDNSQLATRMNWEAAKALEFGLTEEEALNFVTLNPAKQLRIDHRIGSLEPGKDGDFVVWNGNPLSTNTRCEQTWIEGRRYFDLLDDAEAREEIRKRRAVLIQKVHAAKAEGSSVQPPTGHGPRRPGELEEYSCIEEVFHD